MNHTPEFQQKQDKSGAEQAAKDLAAAYARAFASPDGQRVLADLRAKFGLKRLSFVKAHGDPAPYDPIAAALRDGQRQVMSEIEMAIETGTPLTPPSTTNRNA